MTQVGLRWLRCWVCVALFGWGTGALCEEGRPRHWDALLEDPAAGPAADEGPPSVPKLAIALGAAGGVGLVGAAATGITTAMMQAEVERRAERQLLVFPRDASLVRSGETLALVTNGLVLTGAALLVGGLSLWVAQDTTPADERVAP